MRHLTEEHKRKVSLALKGKKKPPFTEEHLRKLREIAFLKRGIPFPTPWMVGTKQSSETIAKRMKNMIGSGNPMWKGNEVSYRSLHKWVERWLGKPSKCIDCGVIANGHKIHWANISKKYKRDLDDWIRLCAKCHKHMDMERRVG